LVAAAAIWTHDGATLLDSDTYLSGRISTDSGFFRHPIPDFDRPQRQNRASDRQIETPKQVKEHAMSQTIVERTAEHIADSAHQASRATNAVADAIGNGVGVARRAAKQSGDAAEEFLNDTTQRIQRHPVLTVATTFAVGFTAGALMGWMIKRR
jgi:ElaB/YqjD/DUF883 family membrane-anchored ribosome-binding protein